MNIRIIVFAFAVWLFVISCRAVSLLDETTTPIPAPTDTVALPPTQTDTVVPSPTERAPAEPLPIATNTPPAIKPTIHTTVPETGPTAAVSPTPEGPDEAILILVPGPGSRVTSPVRVSGIADPTFEQNLVVRVLLPDGTEVALAPTMIQADVGERGEFELELPVPLGEEENIFIQVYSTSARDGGITHLALTGVTFTPTGPEDIVMQSPYRERIVIITPGTGDMISGGIVHVEGFALASFEQTLVVEVLDADGNSVGTEPVIVQAPDLGVPGPFSADVAYTISASGPGRIVVMDPSPAFGGPVHLSSVEVTLEP